MGDVGKSVKLVFNISNLKGWRGIQPLTEFSESTEKHKKCDVIAPFLNLCLKSWIELHYMV